MSEPQDDMAIACARIAEEAERRTGWLDLSGLKLTELPAEIGGLQHLVTLSIWDTQITELGPLSGLSALQSLDCSGTQITELGPLSGLSALQSLDCSYTQVTELGPLSGLSALQSLNCSYTQITELGPLSGLSALQSLNCSYTQVTELGPLSGLSALQSLYCSYTQVTELGPLSGLSALQSLYCSNTQVTELGPLSGLSALQSLDCSNTQVTDLGPLSGLEALRTVHLSRCRLTSAPNDLWHKKSLKEVMLFEACLPSVPAAVLSSHSLENCLPALRAHLADREAGVAVSSDVKLLLLGNGRAGKTQIMRHLAGLPFQEAWNSTHGVQIGAARLPCGEDELRLQLWDFGGQDIYHGTHALFARTQAVTLLVWSQDTNDARHHERDGLRFRNHPLAYWLAYARHQGHPESPVLVVQTKCDRPEDQARRFPIAQEEAEALPYYAEVRFSARTGRGRATLEEALRDAVAWLRAPERLGRVEIGLVRLRVQRRLEALRAADQALPPEQRRQRTLGQAEFARICAEEGGVNSVPELLRYLNNAGTVLYRKGLFGDRIILDQAWALDAIYAVFQRQDCYRQLVRAKGRFTRDLLEVLVWRERKIAEQELLLGMMVACRICFVESWRDGIVEYVAPDLLPERAALEPELALWWPAVAPEAGLTFTYPLLHGGLMREVIARVGGQAGLNALYWRGGMCVYEAGTRSHGLVEQEMLDEARGVVRVRARGGRAEALLQRLAGVVEAAQQQMGLRPEAVTGSRRPGSEEVGMPEFRQPPVAEPEWFVSYAWGDDTQAGRQRAAAVDRLCAEAGARGIRILRDRDQLGLGERISRFMQRIGQGDRVFVILSEKYLRSPYCMFELSEVWRTSRREGDEFLRRVRLLALPDARFGTPMERVEHARYWSEEHAALLPNVRYLGESDLRQFKLTERFAHEVGEILASLADVVRITDIEELGGYFD